MKSQRQHLKKLVQLSLVTLFFITATVACNNKKTTDDTVKHKALNTEKAELIQQESNEWWQKIVEKEGISITDFNNYGYLFEMGKSNSIKDEIVNLEEALFIVRVKNGGYTIIKSPRAYHDIKNKRIWGASGIFKTIDNDNNPQQAMELEDFALQLPTDNDPSSNYRVTGSSMKAYSEKD